MKDQIEHYNSKCCMRFCVNSQNAHRAACIVHRPIFQQQHPKALQPFLPEIRSFVEHNHYNVLHPILR